MNCPKCNAEIRKEHINIHTDIGHCLNCNHIFKLSETVSYDTDDAFDINNPPQGAWIKRELNQVVIGATTRSPIAFFFVPFILVWSAAAIGGIYGTQLLDGEFNPFMSFFGIPFLIASIASWNIALRTIAGKVELTLDSIGGKIFTGVGNIGLTKTFTWDEITTVKENQSNFRYIGNQGREIQIEGQKRISFGMGVNDSRRYYLFRALKSIIGKVKSKKNFV